MVNGKPASPMSSGVLSDAIHELGSWEEGRKMLIQLLREYEANVPKGTGVNVRETVTGPIVDAAFGYGRPITKTLNSGLVFSVRYTSKIVRDFVMSDEAEPDHVWEPQTTKTVLNLTKDAKNVIIGGAYFGDHAILIADQLRDKGIVHCFELSEENTKLLSMNVRQNHLENVIVNQIGLWSSPNVYLVLEGDDSHATPKEADEGFPATSIDAYAEENIADRIDLIMLDIEGGEMAALQGAVRYLDLPSSIAPCVVFELHSSYTDWSNGIENTNIVRFLTDRGYSVFGIRDYHSNVAMKGKPVELLELEGMFIGGPPHGFNMLATKRLNELDPSVFKFVSGVSPKLLFHREPALHGPLN